MSKVVSFEPMEKMLKGFDIAANAVAVTLGPKGRNVYIDDAYAPKFTNDGATIATNIVLEDKQEDAGAKVLKNTTGQTLDDAGDGTTTTAVLIHAIVHEALKRPENAMVVRESLLAVKPKIVEMIKAQSKPITKKDVKKVALISAENEQLATTIHEIINKIGEDGVITVEDSLDFSTSYEVVNGYEANCGFMSTHFINETKRARCVMEDVPVFVTDKKIAAVQDIQALWEQFAREKITQCVIICDDIENSMLGLFVQNKRIGAFNAVVIRATGDALKDIEAAVGARRVSDETGITFQNVGIEHLGQAKKVISDANKTLFIPKDADKASLYASHLEKFAAEEQNMWIKQRLEKRIAQLRGGVAVLRIGGQDFEREYLKDKADDAIKASKAALQEGVVEGGGMTLWRIAHELEPKTVGEEIVKAALTAPLRKILENAHKDYTEVITKLPTGQGYDAKNDKYVKMFNAGIIDPTKVERCSFENSLVNAANFITMAASVTDYVKPDAK